MACSQDPVVTIQQASPNACNNMQLQPATMCQDGMGQYMTLDMPTQVLQEQQPGLDLTSAQLQVLIDSMQSSSVNADLSSVPGMVVVDNSISSVSGALSMPQMAITMQGTDHNASMPMIVQLQVPAPIQCVQQTLEGPETSLQHMQPVYTTLQGQQVVLVNGPAVNSTMQPQLAACTGTVVSGSSGSAVQVQLQQLQDAVQQLSSQTAAVQQMLMTAQHHQDTTNTATGYVQCVTTSGGVPGQTIILLDPSSGQLTTGLVSSSSQETASLCQDSSSSSWQFSDTTSTPMSTPAFNTLNAAGSAMSGMTAVSVSGPPSTPSPAQGSSSSTAQIISGPQMPQPAGGPVPPQLLMHNGPGHMQQVQVQMPGGNGSGGCAPGLYNTGNGPERGVLMPVHAYSSHGGHSAQQQGFKPHGGYPLKQGHHMHHMQHHRPGHMQSAGSLSYRTVRGSSSNSGRPYGPSAARPGSGPSGNIQAVSGCSVKPAGTGAASGPPAGAQQGPPAPGKAKAGGSSEAAGAGAAPVPARGINTAYACVPVEEGLGSLWSVEQLQASKGGRLFNVQQLAWLPVGDPEPAAQDLYNFQKLKRVVQKLDAVHKNRVKLIKRIHGVADPGRGDLKDVYREVRSLIGELLHEGSMRLRSLQETGVAGLVRLALQLQDALTLGPKEEAA